VIQLLAQGCTRKRILISTALKWNVLAILNMKQYKKLYSKWWNSKK